MSSSHYSDEELLNLILEKEEKSNYAFNLLVSKYQEQLYWFIRKMVLNHEDSDDILQDSFIKAFTGIHSFRSESSLKTWLYSIAYRTSIDFLRKKRHRFFIPIHSLSDVIKDQLKADTYFDGDEAEFKLQLAIADLPLRQREVFIMSYYEKLPLAEIAEILNLSEGSIKTNAHLAREKIKKYLDPD